MTASLEYHGYSERPAQPQRSVSFGITKDYTDFLTEQAMRQPSSNGFSSSLPSGVSPNAGNRVVACLQTCLICASLIITAGCQGRGDDSNAELPALPKDLSLDTVADSLGISVKEASNAVSDATSVVAPHAEALREMTSDELKKLSRWEYRVSELPSSTGAMQLEEHLNTLGRDGWECSAPTVYGDKLRTVCKKQPRAVLQYLKHLTTLFGQ